MLITNIGLLAGLHKISSPLKGKNLSFLPSMQNAFLTIENGVIGEFGNMSELEDNGHHEIFDAEGGTILPAWCDSHSHLVFAAPREDEFVDKIRGLTYEEIASRGGGILNSAKKIREISEDELFEISIQRLLDISLLGTGAIEIKSGYGLDTESELKMLRVIRRLQQSSPVQIRSTFLGAHTIPELYRNNRRAYIELIRREMIPRIAAENLADFIDVFCEKGFFSPEETIEICREGIRHGLRPKIHANQLHISGGVEAGIEVGALSVDHLESMNEESIRKLSESDTIGTMLPGAAFFLRMNYPPARAMIQQNCLLALASDFNPGSCPSGNMNLVVSLACIQMKMLPEEAINAATINGAFAMDLGHKTGSISPGKIANLILTKPGTSLASIPYWFGSNLVRNVMISGNFIGQ